MGESETEVEPYLHINVVSERGVVFLRDQNITPQEMQELCERITEAAGAVSGFLSFSSVSSSPVLQVLS